MTFIQKPITLPEHQRGFHIITDRIVKATPEIAEMQKGMCQIFIQHTSASLAINENADPTVRNDFEAHFNVMVPENAAYYKHTFEGPDDMPAHIKASLLGPSLLIPIVDGKLALGTWQGIYLCEHRNRGGNRRLLVSLWGE